MIKTEIIGNLGSDAEVRNNPDGKVYIKFNIAASTGRRDTDGRYETTWIAAFWNSDGGGLLQYLKKGVKVFVRGDFKVDTRQQENGNTTTNYSISVREIELCSSFNQQVQQQGASTYSSTGQSPVVNPYGARPMYQREISEYGTGSIDDLPF